MVGAALDRRLKMGFEGHLEAYGYLDEKGVGRGVLGLELGRALQVFPGGDHRLHEHVPAIASTMTRFFTTELLA